jgi:hypothetical protein
MKTFDIQDLRNVIMYEINLTERNKNLIQTYNENDHPQPIEYHITIAKYEARIEAFNDVLEAISELSEEDSE